MAPVCQGDESLEQHVEALVQSRVDAEVGLLIGRHGSRDTILLLLPTAQEGNAAPAILQASAEPSGKKQKTSQPDAQIQLSVNSVVEHAIQVATMLPGGLAALGLYLYGPEAAFAHATSQLCQALEGMASPSASGAAADKLLFISSHTRKFVCKHRAAGTPSSASLPVCDFKLAPSLSNLATLTCRYAISITLPILDSMQTLSTHVESAIAAESRRIDSSIGSIQGSIASSTATVGHLQQPLEVELLCPPTCCDNTAVADDGKEAWVTGRIVLEGVLHGRAMVNKRDSVSAAVDLLKADLVASLQARLDVLMTEAEEAGASGTSSNTMQALLQPTSEPGTSVTLRLPTRVFFPVKNTLSFCDYLASGETMSDASARLHLLLGGHADLSQMQSPEGIEEVPGATLVEKWTPCPIPKKSQSLLPCNLTTTVLASTGVALLAVAVASYAQLYQ